MEDTGGEWEEEREDVEEEVQEVLFTEGSKGTRSSKKKTWNLFPAPIRGETYLGRFTLVNICCIDKRVVGNLSAGKCRTTKT